MSLSRRWRTVSPYLLSGLLTTTGTLHFVSPKVFARLIPPQLPGPYLLVYASGAAELLCAAGLAVPRTRRAAGWATAGLFLAVYPGNIQMALDSGGRSTTYQAVAWGRLPLQLPLVVWAVSVARAAGGTPARRSGRASRVSRVGRVSRRRSG